MKEPTDPNDVGPELDAMKELARILGPLTVEERRRVLDWAWQFKGPTYRGGASFITGEMPA